MTRNNQRDDDALEIDRAEEFLRRERFAQRIGVGFLILFVAAGLAGVFGDGPLAHATIESGAATIRFERFARQTYRTNLEIAISGATTPTVNITLPREFLERVDMLDVLPPGSLKQLDGELATFEVPARDGSATLLLRYEPRQYGVLKADVVAGQQPPARVRQIVFF